MKNQHVTSAPLAEPQLDDTLFRPAVMAILGIRPVCRSCGAELSEQSRRSLLAGKRVKCQAGCGWYGNWRDNTILSGSRISNVQFIALFFRFTVPDEIPAIAAQLQITVDTVRFWRDRVR